MGDIVFAQLVSTATAYYQTNPRKKCVVVLQHQFGLALIAGDRIQVGRCFLSCMISFFPDK